MLRILITGHNYRSLNNIADPESGVKYCSVSVNNYEQYGHQNIAKFNNVFNSIERIDHFLLYFISFR